MAKFWQERARWARNLSISANPKLAGSLAALASVLIWSGWIVFTRHGVTTDVPAVTLGLLRYAIPTLVMLPLLLRSGTAYRKAGWLKCAIMVCGSGAPFFLICSLGMTFAPAAHVGVMLPGVMPMFVALFAFLLFGERFGGARLVGYGMVLAGVLALGGASLLEAGAGDWRGHVFAAAFSRFLGLLHAGVQALGPDGLAGGRAHQRGLRRHHARHSISPKAGQALGSSWQTLVTQGFAQGILSGLLALAAYSYAVTVLGASKASAFVSLTPALTAMVAAVSLGEWPDGIAVAAILVVGAGVALASGVASGISFKRRLLPQQS